MEQQGSTEVRPLHYESTRVAFIHSLLKLGRWRAYTGELGWMLNPSEKWLTTQKLHTVVMEETETSPPTQ